MYIYVYVCIYIYICPLRCMYLSVPDIHWACIGWTGTNDSCHVYKRVSTVFLRANQSFHASQ